MGLPRFDTAQLTLFRVPSDDPDCLFELKVDGSAGTLIGYLLKLENPANFPVFTLSLAVFR
jgi:hypothetical protein